MMEKPRLKSFHAQKRAIQELERACFGAQSIQSFHIDSFDGCRISMKDAVDDYLDEANAESQFVQWGLAHFEVISDRPSKEQIVVCQMTQLGEQFVHSFRNHLLFNFETEKPDPEFTVTNIEPMLEQSIILPDLAEWVEKITDPVAAVLRRKLVFKKLAGDTNNGWLTIPKD